MPARLAYPITAVSDTRLTNVCQRLEAVVCQHVAERIYRSMAETHDLDLVHPVRPILTTYVRYPVRLHAQAGSTDEIATIPGNRC